MLNVQYDPWKSNLPLHGRFWVQILPHFFSIHHEPEFQKKMLDRLGTKNIKNSDILSVLYNKPLGDYEKPNFRADLLWRVASHSLRKNFLKMLPFTPANIRHTQKTMNRRRLSVVNFIKRRWSKSFNNVINYNSVGL